MLQAQSQRRGSICHQMTSLSTITLVARVFQLFLCSNESSENLYFCLKKHRENTEGGSEVAIFRFGPDVEMLIGLLANENEARARCGHFYTLYMTQLCCDRL